MQEDYKIYESKYNLQRHTRFANRPTRAQKYGIESPAHLASRICTLVPNEIKRFETLEIFQNAIKNWETSNSPCKLLKVYIHNLEYL